MMMKRNARCGSCKRTSYTWRSLRCVFKAALVEGLNYFRCLSMYSVYTKISEITMKSLVDLGVALKLLFPVGDEHFILVQPSIHISNIQRWPQTFLSLILVLGFHGWSSVYNFGCRGWPESNVEKYRTIRRTSHSPTSWWVYNGWVFWQHCIGQAVGGFDGAVWWRGWTGCSLPPTACPV
jgi:hypothetical protein